MKGYVGPRLAFVLDCVFRKLNFDAPTEFHPKATTICEDLAPCPQAPTIPEAKSNAIFDEYIGSKNNAIHARNLTIEHWTLAECPVVLLATPFFENNRASAINFYNGEDAIPVLNAEENFVADCRNFVDCTHLSQVGRSDFTKYISQLLGKLMDDEAWKSNWNESTLRSTPDVTF